MDIYRTLDSGFLVFGNKQIRVIIDKKDKLWFNLQDAAIALAVKKYANIKRDKTLRSYMCRLSEIDGVGAYGQPHTIYISEPGLYRLMGSSEKGIAVRFTDWLYNVVAPAIRKYGKYQLKIEYESEIVFFLDKINDLEEENKILKQDLKKNKFPEGGLVYVIEHKQGAEIVYRIGMTGNMTSRKRIHDTHTVHNNPVVYMAEHPCPIRLELCIRALLYDYRIRNKKDFYDCSLETIVGVIEECIRSLASCDVQKGGSKIGTREEYPLQRILRESRMHARSLRANIRKLDKQLYGNIDTQ